LVVRNSFQQEFLRNPGIIAILGRKVLVWIILDFYVRYCLEGPESVRIPVDVTAGLIDEMWCKINWRGGYRYDAT